MMYLYLVLMSLLIKVSLAQFRFRNYRYGVYRKNYNNIQLNEKGEWIWGYADPILTPQNSEEWIWGNADPDPVGRKEKMKELCSPYNPRKPNYNIPGRRISEIKCYEYVWELKTRYKRTNRSIKYILDEDYADPFSSTFLGVVRGQDTQPGEYPHMGDGEDLHGFLEWWPLPSNGTVLMGAIGWKAATGTWVFKCGSSLISSKFVLTAGHCSRASIRDSSIADPVPKIVRLGDKNIIDVYTNGVHPTDARIVNIYVHPLFRPPKKYYDIALMELDLHVEFRKYIQPACLWTRFNTSLLDTEAVVTGWGVVESHGKTTSPELQAAVVDLLDSKVCDTLLKPSCNRNWCGLKDNQICAGKLAGGVDACQGDSGGPLQVKLPLPVSSEGNMHFIVGVTSFGIGCGLPNLPGIYSRVSMYLDWIEPIVWPML